MTKKRLESLRRSIREAIRDDVAERLGASDETDWEDRGDAGGADSREFEWFGICEGEGQQAVWRGPEVARECKRAWRAFDKAFPAPRQARRKTR